jgi:hypothetical protein
MKTAKRCEKMKDWEKYCRGSCRKVEITKSLSKHMTDRKFHQKVKEWAESYVKK